MVYAITVIPRNAGTARLEDIREPPAEAGRVLVRVLAVGFCRTDNAIVSGSYGSAPDGRERLIIGHESAGRVVTAPPTSGLSSGDLVAGIVRRDVPGRYQDFSRRQQGREIADSYAECGIHCCDGFAAEYYRCEPEHLITLDQGLGIAAVLAEPAAVVAKAWEQLDLLTAGRDGRRLRTVAVVGAGPVGLLAALLGADRGLDVHVVDQIRDGIKPELVKDLGATYHCDGLDVVAKADAALECTGAASVVSAVLETLPSSGLLCLTGLSSGSRTLGGPSFTSSGNPMRLDDKVIMATVGAARRHYEAAGQALGRADRSWLERIITRSVPIASWATALEQSKEDIKRIVIFDEAVR